MPNWDQASWERDRGESEESIMREIWGAPQPVVDTPETEDTLP